MTLEQKRLDCWVCYLVAAEVASSGLVYPGTSTTTPLLLHLSRIHGSQPLPFSAPRLLLHDYTADYNDHFNDEDDDFVLSKSGGYVHTTKYLQLRSSPYILR